MKSAEIRSVGDLADTVAELPEGVWWYRGHARWTWQPRPTLLRDPELTRRERAIFREAQHRLRTSGIECPASDDFAGWQVLMRHVGVPSRFLDWTEAPLVALWFAVQNEREDDHDGGIVLFDPERNNRRSVNVEAVVTLQHQSLRETVRKVVDYLVGPTIRQGGKITTPEDTFEQGRNQLVGVTAVYPVGTVPRIAAQRSMMTFHARNEPEFPDQALAEQSDTIAYWKIPKAAKPEIRHALERLRVRGSTAFPDNPDHIGAEIARDFRRR